MTENWIVVWNCFIFYEEKSVRSVWDVNKHVSTAEACHSGICAHVYQRTGSEVRVCVCVCDLRAGEHKPTESVILSSSSRAVGLVIHAVSESAKLSVINCVSAYIYATVIKAKPHTNVSRGIRTTHNVKINAWWSEMYLQSVFVFVNWTIVLNTCRVMRWCGVPRQLWALQTFTAHRESMWTLSALLTLSKKRKFNAQRCDSRR